MTTHQDVLEKDSTTAPRMNWIVRLLLVLSAGGGIWYFYRNGDYVGVAFVWVTLVASFSGFRMGLTRMGASVVALGAAICVAPPLGMSQEARFAQWLGTTGLINRFVSIAVVGLIVAFVLTLILSAVSTRMMNRRPRLARGNAWLGFGTGAAQGVASVLLMLGGLLIIEPYEIQRASASAERTARAQMVSRSILKVTEQTRQSAFGPWIEQYNPFTRFPQLNKLEQVQQSVQVLSNPGKIEELLHHPSIRQIQSRPEVKNAVNQLMDDPEIQQVLHSGEPMTRESAMQLLSHPAVLELIDQPGFLEEATRVIEESNLLRQVNI